MQDRNIKNAQKLPETRLVEVIPISRGIGRETLTYFTTKAVTTGSLVWVPVRKKTIPALVISVGNAHSAKSEIKEAGYSMKKIMSVREGEYLLPAFIKAAEETAHYFITTTGAVIETLTPKVLWSELLKSPSREFIATKTHTKNADNNLISEKYLFQTEEKERLASYKSLIREEFARGNSVFFCLPTIIDIERALPLLERGIEEFTYVLHSKVKGKSVLHTWKKILKEKHPVLIVGTGQFLSIPRRDIKTIIVERENAGGYKTVQRPFFDIRSFTEFFARALGAKLIWGDLVLRTETLYRKEQGVFLEYAPLKFRSLVGAEQRIVDMTELKDRIGKNKFTLISDVFKNHIQEALESNERAFLLTARRGLYPITVCGDCGLVVHCKNCRSPLVLHSKEVSSKIRAKNIFLCHWCGVRTESLDICEKCSSWRVTPLGIGALLIEKELKRLFPKNQVFRLDKDNAPTRSKAQKIAAEFYASPGSIMVGTEMAVSYLEKKIATVGVASIDSLFTLADFRISERVFSLLLRLRGRAGSHFVIQTRVPDTLLFNEVVRGNLLGFYREEISLREKFNYPPFAILIKINATATKQKLLEELQTLKTLLKEYNPEIYPAFVSKIKNNYIMNTLIRVKSETWPDHALQTLLRSLPPSFIIKVDPESIL